MILILITVQQPHIVQTAMSSENTPILSGAIPAFELFMAAWKAMVADPDLEPENVEKFIQPGLDLANKYYNRFGDTDAYIIAMCKHWLLLDVFSPISEHLLPSYQSVDPFRMD